jgi:hypothetical protein
MPLPFTDDPSVAQPATMNGRATVASWAGTSTYTAVVDCADAAAAPAMSDSATIPA